MLQIQRELKATGYWVEGINTGSGGSPKEAQGSNTGSSNKGPLPLNSRAAVDLTERIKAAHAMTLGSLVHSPSSALGYNDGAGETLSKHEAERDRHRAQRTAIVRELHALGVLGQGHAIIEVGAGNGELSLAIAEAHPEACMRDALVLLDQGRKPRGRSGHARQSADAALAESWDQFVRLKLDVQHVDLASLRDTVAPGRSIVVIAKHLCGAASDFTLRAFVSACDRSDPPLAVVLGTCCHHRCEWTAYPNRKSLTELLVPSEAPESKDQPSEDKETALAQGSSNTFGRDEFELICRLSSRGVDGADLSARADAGRRAKDLLDHGRAEYLRGHGFKDARLVPYVDASVTPENVLIVARATTLIESSESL